MHLLLHPRPLLLGSSGLGGIEDSDLGPFSGVGMNKNKRVDVSLVLSFPALGSSALCALFYLSEAVGQSYLILKREHMKDRLCSACKICSLIAAKTSKMHTYPLFSCFS